MLAQHLARITRLKFQKIRYHNQMFDVPYSCYVWRLDVACILSSRKGFRNVARFVADVAFHVVKPACDWHVLFLAHITLR